MDREVKALLCGFHRTSSTPALFALVCGLLLGVPAPSKAISFTFTKIADTSTAIPSASGKFTAFGNPSLSDGQVAFRGFGTSQRGIYTDVPGSLTRVADTNTAIPSGSGKFTAFGNPSLSDGHVAFRGLGTSQEGIYTDLGGSLTAVIDLSVPLDGKTLVQIGFGRTGLDGTSLAFLAFFGDGSRGIYRADDPVAAAPSALFLLGSGFAGVGGLAWRRRRRKES